MAEGLDEAVALLVRLARAASTRALYPADHPQAAAATRELVGALDRCLRKRGEREVTFLVVDQDVILDDRPLRTKSVYVRPFARLMGRLGVQRLTLMRGLGEDEAREIVSTLAGISPVVATPHATVGRVAFALGDAEGGEAGDASGRRRGLAEEDLDLAAGAFQGLPSSRAGVEQLDQLIWHVMEGVSTASRSMLLLAPIRSFDEQLFQHSMNVSILAVALARSLGIDGAPLHDIGLGALLHDIGKLALPRAIWAGEGTIVGDRWDAARLHPELGAAMLSGVEGVPPVAVLVAYEHHLRFDCGPSYPQASRPPNLASQITAVADSWDLMVGNAAGAQPGAVAAWQGRAGTFLDPYLVEQLLAVVGDRGEGEDETTGDGGTAEPQG